MEHDMETTETPVETRTVSRKTKRSYIRRAAPERTKQDAAAIGVASHPGDATRAEVEREERYDLPERLTRISRYDTANQPLMLPDHRRKPGWDYEFKTISVLGQPVDGSDFAFWHQQGWRPEQPKDWPELCPPGYSGATVDQRGQRLFGRPKRLSQEAAAEDYQAAKQQEIDRMRAAQEGRPTGGGAADVRGIVVKPLQFEIEGEAGTYANKR
jgi:hypothetical protein